MGVPFSGNLPAYHVVKRTGPTWLDFKISDLV